MHEILPPHRRQPLHEAPSRRRLDFHPLDILEEAREDLGWDVPVVVDAAVVADEIPDDHSFLQPRVVLVDVQHDHTEGQGIRSIAVFQVDTINRTRGVAVLDVLAVVGLAEGLQHPVDLLRLPGQPEGLHDASQGVLQVRSAHVVGVHKGLEDRLRVILGLAEKLAHGGVGHRMVEAAEDPRQLLRPLLDRRVRRGLARHRRQRHQIHEPALFEVRPCLLWALLQHLHQGRQHLPPAPLLPHIGQVGGLLRSASLGAARRRGRRDEGRDDARQDSGAEVNHMSWQLPLRGRGVAKQVRDAHDGLLQQSRPPPISIERQPQSPHNVGLQEVRQALQQHDEKLCTLLARHRLPRSVLLHALQRCRRPR
mmetsp:Transcript_43188/g.122169  ORF Transcript_43188/g.122169 Transcript_43188/m.122169 type:complete len:366 (+) Transcript_43188:1019-2116(+)